MEKKYALSVLSKQRRIASWKSKLEPTTLWSLTQRYTDWAIAAAHEYA